MAVGGALGLIRRVGAGEAAQLPSLAGDVLFAALSPYLDAEAARGLVEQAVAS